MSPFHARRQQPAHAPSHFVQLPSAPVCYSPGVQSLTIPAPVISPSTDHNSSADAQHAATGALSPASDRPAEQLSILDTTRGQRTNRTFRVQNGLLEEQVEDTSAPEGRRWILASAGTNPHGAVQSFYFADGQLYDSAGNRLGRFGINTQAGSSLGQSSFLTTYGTLQHETTGQLIDYSGLTMSLGSTRSLIIMGPPPGMVPVYVESTRDVLMDSQCGRFFHQRNGDRAFERRWVRPGDAPSVAAHSLTPSEIRTLPLSSDGYRFSADGRMRFRSNSDGVFSAEARLHLATNWRGRNGLEMARVGWSAAPSLIRTEPPVVAVLGPEKLPVVPIAPVEKAPIPKSSTEWELPAKKAAEVEKIPPPRVVQEPEVTVPVAKKAVTPPVDPLPPVLPPPRIASDLEADALLHLFVVSRYFSDLTSDAGRGMAPPFQPAMQPGMQPGVLPGMQPGMLPGGVVPGLAGGAQPQETRLGPIRFLLAPPQIELALTGGAEVPRDLLRAFLMGHGVARLEQNPGGVEGGQPPAVAQNPAAAVIQLLEAQVGQGVDVQLRGFNAQNPLPYYQQVQGLFAQLSTTANGQYDPLAVLYSQSGPQAEMERTRFLTRLRRMYENRQAPPGCQADFWMNAIDMLEDDLERRVAEREGRQPRPRRPAGPPGPLA